MNESRVKELQEFADEFYNSLSKSNRNNSMINQKYYFKTEGNEDENESKKVIENKENNEFSYIKIKHKKKRVFVSKKV